MMRGGMRRSVSNPGRIAFRDHGLYDASVARVLMHVTIMMGAVK